LIALEREGQVVAHDLEREPTTFEREILDPDLSRIVDPASRAVATAELGIARGQTTVYAYEFVGE